MNSLGRQRLIDDAAKCFGDLNSIFSLPGGDKMDGMMCVGWGKFGRVTTQGLLEG